MGDIVLADLFEAADQAKISGRVDADGVSCSIKDCMKLLFHILNSEQGLQLGDGVMQRKLYTELFKNNAAFSGLPVLDKKKPIYVKDPVTKKIIGIIGYMFKAGLFKKATVAQVHERFIVVRSLLAVLPAPVV
jgi:hypothetical protein